MTILKLVSGISWKLGKRFDGGGFGEVHSVTPDSAPAFRGPTPRGFVAKLVPKADGIKREVLLGADVADVPNVVPVIDSGETPKHWVLVMPRAEFSLEKRLEKGGLSEAEAVAVLTDVLTALDALVARKVVHRDIKPSNILFWNGHWCLVDFGISKYAEAVTATDTQKFAWTDEYAAPERWRHQTATIKTDVYSLGVVGFEMLSGQVPFGGPDFRNQHVQEDMPPLPPSVSAPLAITIEEMMSKPTGARPSPAAALTALTRASTARDSKALSSLGALGVEEGRRQAAELAQREAAEEERERRDGLFLVAEKQLIRIQKAMFEELRTRLPTGSVGDRAIVIREARLDFSPKIAPTRMSDESKPPFDVIAGTAIVLTISPPRHGYAGRGHSLWYCDAKVKGEYGWFEFAYMRSGYGFGTPGNLNPFPILPGDANGGKAFQMIGTTFQLARRLEKLELANLSDFVDRWAGWLTQSAQGNLETPRYMPEHDDAALSYRRK